MCQFAARPAWVITAALLVASQGPAAARAASAWRSVAAGDEAGPQAPFAAAPSLRAACVPGVRLVPIVASRDQPPGSATGPTIRQTPPAGASAAPDGIEDTALQAPGVGDDADRTGAKLAPTSPGETGPAGTGVPDTGTSDTGAPGTRASSVSAETAPALPAAPRDAIRRRAGAAAPIGHFRVYEHPPCAGELCQATVSDLDNGRGFEATVSLGPMHLARQLEELARSGQIELLLSGELRHGPAGPMLRALHLEGVTPHAPEPPPFSRPGRAGPPRRAERSHAPVTPPSRLLRA